MNAEQLLHYDLLKIENIFPSALVHWFFAKLWAIKQGPMFQNAAWKPAMANNSWVWLDGPLYNEWGHILAKFHPKLKESMLHDVFVLLRVSSCTMIKHIHIVAEVLQLTKTFMYFSSIDEHINIMAMLSHCFHFLFIVAISKVLVLSTIPSSSFARKIMVI
jgi:hypothetical protein